MGYPYTTYIFGDRLSYDVWAYPLDYYMYKPTDCVYVVVRAEWVVSEYKPYFSSEPNQLQDGEKLDYKKVIYVSELKDKIDLRLLDHSKYDCFMKHGATHFFYLPQSDSKLRQKIMADIIARYKPVCNQPPMQQGSEPKTPSNRQEPSSKEQPTVSVKEETPSQMKQPVSSVKDEPSNRTAQSADIIEKELERINRLKECGIITDEEYRVMRKKVLGL